MGVVMATARGVVMCGCSVIVTAAAAIGMSVLMSMAVVMRGLVSMSAAGIMLMAVLVGRFVAMFMRTTTRSGVVFGKNGSGFLTDESYRMQGTAGACYCCATHGFSPGI
jgi:hypothetical protein